MKKITFSLLIIGLALPMLSLAQFVDVYDSTNGQTGSTTNIQMKAELFKNKIQSLDIYKSISPVAPIIAPIAPMINNIISPLIKVYPIEDSNIYNIPGVAFPSCHIGDDLMRQYDSFISELQNVQKTNDTEKENLITQKIIELKKQISASKINCGVGSGSSAPILQPSAAPDTRVEIASLDTMRMSKCEEAIHWREKITYYTNMADLSDADLKNQTNLSRDNIKNTLVKLVEGLRIIENACSATATSATMPVQAIINEPIRPVGVQSAEEIMTYYKAQIENITGTENDLNQIQKLKELKKSKDELIGELIKNKKEIQASELGQIVKEIKVNKNEIIADDVSVRMTENRIFLNIGSSSISVVSAGNKIIIKDKDLEISTDGVSISDNSLKIDGVEVKIAASEVMGKFNIAPETIELTIENSQPVYKMKIVEQRKLFGLIKINAQNTQTADASNGDLLNESKPWYYFLTTKY